MTTTLLREWRDVLTVDVSGDVRQLMAEAELRRSSAEYDTGSISEDEAGMLIALAEFIQARVVIEVGTFIGTSTTALASASCVEAVFTCDISNDCLPSFGVIRTYPKQSSTQMLRDLLKKQVRADLCFFDGTLNESDVEMLRRLTHAGTVYAFHDYNYGPKIRNKGGQTYMQTMPRKGVGNVNLLRPHLPHHQLIDPPDGSTMALLVPEARS